MPLIIKAAGERLYARNSLGDPWEKVHPLQRDTWSYVKDRSDVADLFAFSITGPCISDGSRYIPAPRDEIFIYKNESDYTDDIRWFGGLLTDIRDQASLMRDNDFSVVYNLQAQAFNIILDKELRQPLVANKTWGELIRMLVQKQFIGQLSQELDGIVNPIQAPPVKINNGTMRDLLRAMRTMTGYDFTVDQYKKLRVFQATNNPAPFTLDDSISGILQFVGKLDVQTEARQIFNIVRQPFRQLVHEEEWAGETFTGKGDPKGTGGQLPLLRTPVEHEDATPLEDQFDGDALDETIWIETDTTTTEHVDYPNQGHLFTAEGQLQVLGGTGTLGGVALTSQNFFEYQENYYLVMGFQLTNATGDGYISLFTDGEGLATSNFKGGLRVQDGALKTLGGTTLVASLGVPTAYLLWVIQTADGWQYDIYGGDFATRRTLHIETGITHLSDYVLAPIVNKSLECSIDFIRYQTNSRGVILEIDGQKKTVGTEGSFAGLPDIDAYLNTDETPAVLKFRGATAFTGIASVTNDTHFSVITGQGVGIQKGHRLIIGTGVVEAFNGQDAVVSSITGDAVVLESPGLSGLTPGMAVLVNTTIPAKDAKIVVRYAYEREDEAVVRDADSVARFSPYPLTLDPKDHIRTFEAAQQEALNQLQRFKDGILHVNFSSNSKVIAEPDSLMALVVNLTRRPDPIARVLTIQRVIIRPTGKEHFNYQIEAESADPVKPLDDLVKGRDLIIGGDGSINFGVALADETVADSEDIDFREVSSVYITLANPEHLRLGEIRLGP